MLKITGKQFGEILMLPLKKPLSAVDCPGDGAFSCDTDTLSLDDLGQTNAPLGLSSPCQKSQEWLNPILSQNRLQMRPKAV